MERTGGTDFSDDSTVSDVASLRCVFGKMIEETSIMDCEMEALKSNSQSLKDGLKQLYFEKEQNISQAANLKDQINLLKQHEQSLSCGLTKLRLKIKRDRELESTMHENLREVRLSDLEKMTICNQDVEKCIQTMTRFKESYAKLPWVREKIQKSAELQIRRVMSLRCEQIAKDVAAEELLMTRLERQRLNAEILDLSRLMVKWKAQSENNWCVESSVGIGRKDVLDLKRRKKELSESIANKTESIIHEILSRTGSGGKRRAPLETTVNPSKAPSLRDLLGIRKLEDTFKIPKPPRRSEDDNVELPLASLADEMVASAEEEAALDPPAEPASPQAMVTNNDPLALDHDSVLPEKSDDVSAALALRKADQHTSPVRQEPLSDTSDEGKSSSRPEEMPKCGSPPTLKQVQSLRAILKPPPTIGEEFPPPPQLNQPIPLNPLGTILNTVVKPNGVPASQATTGNAESEAAAKQSVSVDAKLSRPQLNWTVQIITSPVRSKDDRPALPAATGVVPMETQSELIERHEPQASNVIVLSDSGDSCCSEPKIPKIDRMSMSLAPNAIKLPQQGRPQKKTKKVSFLAKNVTAEPGQENSPRVSPAGPVSPPKSSHSMARQVLPLKLNQKENIPLVPVPSPQPLPEASPFSKENNVFDSCFGDIFGQGALQTQAGPSTSPSPNSGADFFNFGGAAQLNSSDKPLTDFFSFF